MKKRNNNGKPPRVIVVGAGMSGLACASHLIQSGIDDVTVLEARDRIGGRISTVRSPVEDDLFFFEEGAQWIHGYEGNEVKTFVDENSIQSIKHLETTEYYFENEKSPCSDSEMLRTLQQSTDTFFQILEDAEDGIDTRSHKNVLSYLDEKWSKKTNNTDYITSLYRCLIEHQRAEEGCNSMREVGISNYNQYQHCTGGDLSVVGGLDMILNKLASKLEQKRILLKKRVMKVNWSNTGQVLLNVRDTSYEKEEVFPADIVVLTIPLGFLKENHKKLFVPSLPVNKSKAIENLGCGSVAKVILRFDQQLCDDVPVTWLFLRKIPFSFGYYKATVTKCYANSEQFLTIWLTGEGAIKAEKTSEEELLATFNDDLRQFVPNLPQPKSAQVTKWTEDPYTRGSYTYISVDSSADDLKQMAEPLSVNKDGQLVAKVLFAGEATHSRYYSAMHGAYESGIREAERIIKIFK